MQPFEEPPTRYSMEDNYPNPFNPTTQFRFTLPVESIASLIIYDVLGRQVAVLAGGVLAAGSYSEKWNASYLASGLYFARLLVKDEIGNVKYSKVNKLLLVK